MNNHRTILVVDDDLGFVVWLGQTLVANGYLTVPAASAPQATVLLAELQIATIDLAIVNLALPSTTTLIDSLRSRHPSLKIIAVLDPIPDPIARIDVDAIGWRSQFDWLTTVRRVLGDNASTP
jgi:DNA-binding NtrC family response regulator